MQPSSLKLVLLLFVTLRYTLSKATVSYSEGGTWEEVPPKSDLCDRFLCTPSKHTWKPASDKFKIYDNVTACEALLKKGINKVFFHGDSYTRQMYAALLITLNGDYKYGSISNPQTSPQCEYHKQFNEKNCGTRQLNHYGKVCGDQIILDPILNGFSNDNHCSNSPGTVIVWSFGNYKLARGGRHGVNNASAYQGM